MQNTSVQSQPTRGLHVALIMDENGRWAQRRGLPRTAGHKAGADAVRRVIEAAPQLGINTLTLYAFSSDNWQRPAPEVSALMKLLRLYLLKETANCVRNGVRISVIGRRDRLGPDLVALIEAAEKATGQGRTLHVRVALDYSARETLLRAVNQLFQTGKPPASRAALVLALGQAMHADEPARDVDLLVRTSGEQRLSDFLLWECAYAELYFTPCLWPDFDRSQLAEAVTVFHQRQRRFGGLAVAAAG
ncbi:MAG: di-trans,poly-cis-decaprenylcistransferase [Acidobacteria bacterium]|nr:di-trans,poly-cis-decaprenylcistransferase [Acidobacteriota bacterium]MBI3427048.1 di-trans,poly-cis-decaprenylcistransferase [Acidobacteriota bacterium]